MLKVKLLNNHYIFFRRASLLTNYVSFAKKINIFKNLIENFSVRGEGRREKAACQLRAQVLRLAASRIGP